MVSKADVVIYFQYMLCVILNAQSPFRLIRPGCRVRKAKLNFNFVVQTFEFWWNPDSLYEYFYFTPFMENRISFNASKAKSIIAWAYVILLST